MLVATDATREELLNALAMHAAVCVVLLGAAANIHNVSGYGAACLVAAALLVLVWPLVEYLCKPAPAPFGGLSSPQSTLAGGPAQRPSPAVASAVSTPKSQSPVGSLTRGKGGKGFHEGAAPGDVAFSADVMRQLTGRGVASGTALDDLAAVRSATGGKGCTSEHGHQVQSCGEMLRVKGSRA